jgi:hypothetical protein
MNCQTRCSTFHAEGRRERDGFGEQQLTDDFKAILLSTGRHSIEVLTPFSVHERQAIRVALVEHEDRYLASIPPSAEERKTVRSLIERCNMLENDHLKIDFFCVEFDRPFSA